MINETLGLIIVILLLINAAFVGVGDLILLFMFLDIKIKLPERESRKRQDEDEDDLVELVQHGPESGSIRVPHHRLPAFFDTMIQRAKASGGPPPNIEENEKKETKTPAGYL